MSDQSTSGSATLRSAAIQAEGNRLFPVFLKLENLSLLIVGGGYVGMEKLNVILQNSPRANIRIVATHISDDIKRLVAHSSRI